MLSITDVLLAFTLGIIADMYVFNKIIIKATITYLISTTRLKLNEVGTNMLFTISKIAFTPITESTPPIIIPNAPIIVASKNIILNTCPSVPPILFNIA